MQKIYKFFSSSSLALLLLLIFAVSMAAATFIENDYGTAIAWASIYDAWWFEMVMLGLAISFVFNIKKYNLFTKKKWAVLLFHIAFIIIVLGAAVTRYVSYGGIMRIREGATSNVIIADTKLLIATITDGTQSKTIQQKTNISPLKNNDFTLKTTFNNKAVSIDFNQYVADATPTVITDSINGEPLLKMVVTAGKGRNTIYLKKGEIERIGDHQHEIGFESDKKGIINIIEDNGRFKMLTPHTIDFFIMASQQAGKIKKDSLQNITLRTLYRAGDFSFVPMSYHPKGAFKLISNVSEETVNDKTLDDALIVNATIDTEQQEINLLYREGFLPIKHQTDFKNDIKLIISYGAGAIKLPFSVKLNDFQLDRYPGSSSPSAYASEVTVFDKKEEFSYRIFMNNVLDYKGYRFFQASYDTDEKGTVLSVNHDVLGTWLTYIGYTLMGIGMLFTFFGKGSRFREVHKKLKRLSKNTIAIMAFLSISSAFSQTGTQARSAEIKTDSIPSFSISQLVDSQQIDIYQADQFGRLLVQDLDGRIKPLNTLASECIRKITKKTSFSYPKKKNNETIRLSVNQIFLGMHMSPQLWQRIPIIKADFEKTGTLLNTVKVGDNNLLSFVSLLDKQGNYLLSKAVEEANKKKPSARNELDKEVLNIDERFNILYNVFSGNYLKIFPKKDDDSNTWYSYIHDFKDFNEEDRNFAKHILPGYFNDIYKNKYEEAYKKLSYIKKYQEILGASVNPSEKQIEAELWYNKAKVNFWLFIIYFSLGTLLLVLAVVKMFHKNNLINFLWNFLVIIILISFLCFSANILLRWFISGHAPWSNGYEMLIFVAWSLLLSGLASFRKSDFALPLATLFTGALLFVSYLDWLNPEITNLMPVLKSYWLKIHVATIVSSYAPLALSAVLGFMALVLMLFKTDKNKHIIDIKIKELTYINELSMTIGLFVLAIGTFLGGVWANESWGRYWAWDPKETWALISIIVYAIVLHLRFVPKLNTKYVLNLASMFAFWAIMMTSFGVNYYLSGLHSYAAGDAIPIPTFVYVLLAIMVIISLLVAYKQKYFKK
ncbi:cytochrome c biogenesis protein [Tenacibaculum finnmarkense]|uniref:cytochrome c biogenesis protein n=1 Tax=Tenacibaculum finnmarkense TaxID=2781243 RepID=UPI0023011FB6|nr:cytochrome c biogenesis protein CcsA [Tenacibaculum finnmarkense]WCC48281.1 cytochrome c biogenesis protein CcsA [Tenacibaculum finnmarkense]